MFENVQNIRQNDKLNHQLHRKVRMGRQTFAKVKIQRDIEKDLV